LSGQLSELEQLVRARFSVKEFFALPDGELEFQVLYEKGTKQKFAQLQSETAARGYRPELTGTKEECVLTLRKVEPPPRSRSRVPVLLALFTLASLVVVALLQRTVYEQLVPSLAGYLVFFEFGATIVALLGAHELGQRLTARDGQAGHSNSYLIPGIPFLPPFLPSLGFANTQREPALNRDHLFDVVIAGPLAVVGLAIVAYVIGDLTVVPSSVTLQSTQLSNTTISINANAIQFAIDSILSPFVPSAPAGHVLVSPIADGATVGFILAFIGLLPMAIFDGGLLSSIAWGERAARATTYLSVLLLLVIDMNYATYWAIAIVALLLAGRPVRLKFLDDVSGLSSSRQWIFVGSLVLAFLCLPVPHSLATFPLP
jgi:hypothetical protein